MFFHIFSQNIAMRSPFVPWFLTAPWSRWLSRAWYRPSRNGTSDHETGERNRVQWFHMKTWCTCVCVCIYICIYMYMEVYVNICTYVSSVKVCKYIYMYKCVYTSYICIYIYYQWIYVEVPWLNSSNIHKTGMSSRQNILCDSFIFRSVAKNCHAIDGWSHAMGILVALIYNCKLLLDGNRIHLTNSDGNRIHLTSSNKFP